MGLHLIVECDTNTIHCSLLEFMVRCAFAWNWQDENRGPTERVGGSGGEHLWSGQEESMTPDAASVVLGSPVLGLNDNYHMTKIEDDPRTLYEIMFDNRTFSNGMIAKDFQAQLQRLTTMTKSDIEEMLEGFFVARQKHVCEKEARKTQRAPTDCKNLELCIS